MLMAALLLGRAAGAAEHLPLGWENALDGAKPFEVKADPVKIIGDELPGLVPAGAWVLRGAHPNFRELSGLIVDGDRLFAVTDEGWWFGATLIEDDGALSLTNARLAEFRGVEGGNLFEPRRMRDAEGLTRLGNRLWVSFERDNRLMMLGRDGRLDDTIGSSSFGDFEFDEENGLEALATLPYERMIAFDETSDAVFLIGPAGHVTETSLPRDGRHLVTGADIGPDNKWLYLVLREYIDPPVDTTSIWVMRYKLGSDGWPQAGSAVILAKFDTSGVEKINRIDNMEGISLERGPDGRIRLWLISDDNGKDRQRTLLMRFEVLP